MQTKIVMTTLEPIDLKMQQFSVPAPMIGEVRVYTFEVNGELILFDTGSFNDEAKEYLCREVDLERLRYVFITHWHPEHAGLAAFLEQRTSAEIIISRADAERLKNITGLHEQITDVFVELGFPLREALVQSGVYRRLFELSPVPDQYRLLEDSQALLSRLGISWFYCPWHSGSDVVYQLQNYAITGDTVLEQIFSCPSIEVKPGGGRFNNYASLCDAISLLKQIERCHLLPSHRQPVASIEAWIEFVVTKLTERTRALSPLLLSEASVYRVTREFFDSQLDEPFMFYMKASEVVLSQDFLQAPELLSEALDHNGLLDKFKHLLQSDWLAGS